MVDGVGEGGWLAIREVSVSDWEDGLAGKWGLAVWCGIEIETFARWCVRTRTSFAARTPQLPPCGTLLHNQSAA